MPKETSDASSGQIRGRCRAEKRLPTPRCDTQARLRARLFSSESLQSLGARPPWFFDEASTGPWNLTHKAQAFHLQWQAGTGPGVAPCLQWQIHVRNARPSAHFLNCASQSAAARHQRNGNDARELGPLSRLQRQGSRQPSLRWNSRLQCSQMGAKLDLACAEPTLGLPVAANASAMTGCVEPSSRVSFSRPLLHQQHAPLHQGPDDDDDMLPARAGPQPG